MKYSKLLTIVSVTMLATTSFAGELWLKAGAEGKVYDDVKIKIEEEIKFENGDFYDEETAMMLEYSLSKYFTIGAGLKIVEEKKDTTHYKKSKDSYKEISDHYWTSEMRPTIDLTGKFNISDWKFDNRLRIEFRDKENSDCYVRYRDRIRVRSPWKITSLYINPYASWECFVEDKNGLSGSDKFNRMRSQIGFGYKITDKLSGGFYYMSQSEKKDDFWKSKNILGIELSAKF